MILIIGANGQLGSELSLFLTEKGVHFTETIQKELDITDEKKVMNFFNKNKPTIVYHCAAYTAVDKAEDEGKKMNYEVNVLGTEYVAKACEKVGATLVYISTDYVFDGHKKNGPYLETDLPNPINEYGRAKLLGEKRVQEYCSKAYIIRTTWVFGEFGNNFVYTMLRLSETHDTLTVVNDQSGRPTWTKSLAQFMVHLVDTAAPFGLYNFSNEGTATWYEFAKEILKNHQVTVLPVTSSEFPQKAQRPEYSVLDLTKAEKTGFQIPSWQDALKNMLKDIDKKSERM